MAPLHRAAGCVTLVAYQSCASCRRLFNIFGVVDTSMSMGGHFSCGVVGRC